MKILKRIKFPNILIILFICGLLFGLTFGYIAYKSYILRKSRLSLMINLPVNNFFLLNSFLYSDNVLKRTLAYYGLAELQILNMEFLADRFDEDSFDFEKRTLLWVIAQGKDRNIVINNFLRIFNLSDNRTKLIILDHLKTIDPAKYNDLMKQLDPKVRKKYRKKSKVKKLNINYQA